MSSFLQLSCSLLSAVLTEFSNSSGSSNIGMPIEFHVKCKISIQVCSLNAIYGSIIILQHWELIASTTMIIS